MRGPFSSLLTAAATRRGAGAGQVSELTETVLRQSAEIYRLNALLQTGPPPASLEGHSALRGDWVPA